MKKVLIKLLAILSCILPVAAIGNAQTVKISKIEIPFDFIVKDKVFQAGNYTIEQLSNSNPNLLILKNVDGDEKVILLARVSTGEQTSEPHLSFRQSERGYFLESILTNGTNKTYVTRVDVSKLKSFKNEKLIVSAAKRSQE